jgi:hypothetical protein
MEIVLSALQWYDTQTMGACELLYPTLNIDISRLYWYPIAQVMKFSTIWKPYGMILLMRIKHRRKSFKRRARLPTYYDETNQNKISYYLKETNVLSDFRNWTGTVTSYSPKKVILLATRIYLLSKSSAVRDNKIFFFCYPLRQQTTLNS